MKCHSWRFGSAALAIGGCTLFAAACTYDFEHYIRPESAARSLGGAYGGHTAAPASGGAPVSQELPQMNATGGSDTSGNEPATDAGGQRQLRQDADAALDEEPDASADAAESGNDEPEDSGVSGFDCEAVGGKQAEGHCYFAVMTASSWQASLCEAEGAHLISITSAQEQAIAASILPREERWIGLYRPRDTARAEASYTWITGEGVSLTQWDSYSSRDREPNYSGDCVRLRGESWADDDCRTTRPYVCERE